MNGSNQKQETQGAYILASDWIFMQQPLKQSDMVLEHRGNNLYILATYRKLSKDANFIET